MSLFRRLMARAGLIVLDAPTAAASAGQVDPNARTRPIVERRSVTLDGLLAEGRAERAAQQEALESAAAGLSADVAQVYAAAGVVAPEHGWTVDKAVAFVTDPERADQDREEQRRALQVQLAIEKIPAEDLFRDAAARDGAVDAYENFLKAKVAEHRADLDTEEAQLQRELAELQARMAAVAERRAAMERTWTEWREQKRARERAWMSALALLLAEDQPVDEWVSTDEG